MQIDYKRDLNHTYVILQEEKEPDTASYQIRMLLTNTIPGLLDCKIGKLDDKTLFYYEITSRQSLQSVFEQRSIGASVLQKLFGQLLELLEELGQYLLTPDGLVLQPELIFSDAVLEEFDFCYLPGNQGHTRCFQDQVRGLMEYFLPKLDHQEQEAVVLGYGLYREIASDIFSIEAIQMLLYQNGKEQSVDGQEKQKQYRTGMEERKSRTQDQTQSRTESRIQTQNRIQKEQEEKKREGQKRERQKRERQKLERQSQERQSQERQGREWEKPEWKKSEWQDQEWQEQDWKEQTLEEEGITTDAAFFAEPEPKSGSSRWKNLAEAVICIGFLGGVLVLRWTQAEVIWYLILAGLAGGIECGCLLAEKLGKKREKQQFPEAETRDMKENMYTREQEEWQINQLSDQQKRQADEMWKSKERQNAEVWREENPGGELREESQGESQEDLFEKTELLVSPANEDKSCLVPVEPVDLPFIVLERGSTLIGKLSAAADVILPYRTVSRLHAKIVSTEEGDYLIDLNSRNGTYVNGVPLTGEIKKQLEDGDDISFAGKKYRYKRGRKNKTLDAEV